MLSKGIRKKNNSSARVAGVFLGAGIACLVLSVLLYMQVLAFIGLGLTFWGAIFALTRNGKYVESSLLDNTAKSGYSTIERMINDLKFNAKGYYIPAYPQDVVIPDYLKHLKESAVFISESFDGKPSIDELAAGKFLSTKSQGFFITSPGSGILDQIEKQLQMDFSKINQQEFSEFIPKYLTEIFNLAKNAEVTITPSGANFKATGILYDSFYKTENTLKSVSILGCPVVSAVASALAKTSGKTVVIKEQTFSHGNRGVSVVFEFLEEKT